MLFKKKPVNKRSYCHYVTFFLKASILSILLVTLLSMVHLYSLSPLFSLECGIQHNIFPLSALTGAWLFLDETLKKDKKESSSYKQSSEGQDSGIDLIKESDGSSNGQSQDSDNESEKDESCNHEDEISHVFLDDIDTDSDYEASSDTELIQNIQRLSQRRKAGFLFGRFKKVCAHMCNPLRLIKKVIQRLAECVGVFVFFVTGVKKLLSRCKSDHIRHSSPVNWRSVGSNVWKTVLLLKDRRVMISILLYGIIAFLEIIAYEVSTIDNVV